MRHAAGPKAKPRRWRYPLLGLVVLVTTMGVLVAIERGPRVTEDVVTAAPPVPTPTATPEPTPRSEPRPTTSPTPALDREAAAQPVSGADLANTDGQVALADESYVPMYAVVADLTEYDAHVSVPLEVPTPTATPVPAAPPEAPTAPPPTATPEPPPTPTDEAVDTAPEQEPEPEEAPDEDAEDDGESGGDDGSPTAQQWADLRACESGGNYQIVSANGLYHGAYQFSVGTWDWIASRTNAGLVGVLPSEASPGDQDALAQALYDRRGSAPWPHCGRYLD